MLTPLLTRCCSPTNCGCATRFCAPSTLAGVFASPSWRGVATDRSLQAAWPLEDKQAARAFLSFQALPAEDAVHDVDSEYARGRRAVAVGSTSPGGNGNHNGAGGDGGDAGGATIPKYLPFLFVKDYKTASEALFETLFHFVKGVCPGGKLTNLDDYCATGKLGHGGVEVRASFAGYSTRSSCVRVAVAAAAALDRCPLKSALF